MRSRLRGLTVLVTGAGGGIGAAICQRFLDEGAHVHGWDLHPAAIPVGVNASGVDVTCSAAVQAGFDALLQGTTSTGEPLRAVVNAVGGSGRAAGDGPVDACSESGWDYTIDLNLRSVFLVCRSAIGAMRPAGGSIVNVSSVLGLGGHPLFETHAYAAAKAGVIGLSRAMAASYAPEGIRVNVICPGLIETPMTARAQADPRIRAALPDLQPLTGSMGRPQDVADAAVYLVSEESRFVTGIVLPVDGGWTLR